MATHAERLLTAEEFLRIDFGSDLKAELDRGVIRMMAGGTRDHSRIQTNLISFLNVALQGSPCEPHGSDMAVRTAIDSIRYPDVSVECGVDGDGQGKVQTAPTVVIEILSETTRAQDLGVKLDEYRRVRTVETIAFVDPAARTIKALQREPGGGWREGPWLDRSGLDLPSLDLVIPHEAVFARVA
jgi:Uma2 family endonuclease